MPRVSVLIPCLDQGRYLDEALRSVRAQHFQDFDVFVLDPGSTDETAEVCARHADRVRHVRTGPGGPGTVRNAGAALSDADYLAFLDADDVWMPQRLALQVPVLDARPELALCCGSYLNFYDGSRRIQNFRWLRPGAAFSGHVFERLLVENFVGTQTVLVRRDVFLAAGGFPEHLLVAEDWHLWLRLAAHHELLGLQPLLACRRRHDAQFTVDEGLMLQHRERVLREMLDERDDVPAVSRATRRRALLELGLAQAHHHASRGDFAAARRQLVRSWRAAPTDVRPARALVSSCLRQLGLLPAAQLNVCEVTSDDVLEEVMAREGSGPPRPGQPPSPSPRPKP